MGAIAQFSNKDGQRAEFNSYAADGVNITGRFHSSLADVYFKKVSIKGNGKKEVLDTGGIFSQLNSSPEHDGSLVVETQYTHSINSTINGKDPTTSAGIGDGSYIENEVVFVKNCSFSGVSGCDVPEAGGKARFYGSGNITIGNGVKFDNILGAKFSFGEGELKTNHDKFLTMTSGEKLRIDIEPSPYSSNPGPAVVTGFVDNQGSAQVDISMSQGGQWVLRDKNQTAGAVDLALDLHNGSVKIYSDRGVNNTGFILETTNADNDLSRVSNVRLNNVGTFSMFGASQDGGKSVIDLSSKSKNPGDTFVIDGDLRAGAENMGTSTATAFIMDVAQQTHDANGNITSLADKFIINGNTSLYQSMPVGIYVNMADLSKYGFQNLGADIGAHKFTLVEVNGSYSANDMFQLANVVTRGVSEYQLQFTGKDWVLSNTQVIPNENLPPVEPAPPVEPTPPENGGGSGGSGDNGGTGGNEGGGNNQGNGNNQNNQNGQNGQQGNQPQQQPIFYNPYMTAYLGNQYIANNMFAQNVLNARQTSLGVAQALSAGGIKDVPKIDSLLWANVHINSMEADTYKGQHTLKSTNQTVQMGMDLIQMPEINAGVYVGYGHAKNKVKSNATGSRVEGRIKGWQAGIYASYTPENSGLFVDAWGYYAQFKNELHDKVANRQKAKYDSQGFGLAADVGYKIPVASVDSGVIIVEPHAQVGYFYVDADDFTDGSTIFSDNDAKGVQTKVGARVYKEGVGISPFAEVNWVHNATDNAVHVNGVKTEAEFGKNIGEAKVGVMGKISDNISLWGNVSGRIGTDDYRDYGVQMGIGIRW